VKQIVDKMNNVNPLLITELKSDDLTSQFRSLLIDSLMNYKFAIDEENDRDKDWQNKIFK